MPTIAHELAWLEQTVADTKRRITEQRRQHGRSLSAAIQHLRALEDSLRIRQKQRRLLLDGALSPYLHLDQS
jgi:hypothetical protein